MNDWVALLLILATIATACCIPGWVSDARSAKTPPARKPAPPAYPECARNGCRKTVNPAGEYVCGTCGRSLAITTEAAS